jgi:hypothetical protein
MEIDKALNKTLEQKLNYDTSVLIIVQQIILFHEAYSQLFP